MAEEPEDGTGPSSVSQIRFRLDLVSEVVSADDETGLVKMKMTPDPRRYDRVENAEEGLWYIDKYFGTVFNLMDFAGPQAMGTPIYTSPRTVESAADYSVERRVAVANQLDKGEYIPPKQAAKPHEAIGSLDYEREVSFLSIDICKSSVLRKNDPKAFEIAYRMLIQEMGATIGQFGGSILKVTGDGIIAFVDMESFNTLVDITVDLGGTLLHVLHGGINPALVDRGLSPLSVRIGADFGPAQIRQVAVPLTGYSALEVTSDALNRAVKIEQICAPDTFCIGYNLYRLAHVQWLERSHPVEFDGASIGIVGYEVFEVR